MLIPASEAVSDGESVAEDPRPGPRGSHPAHDLVGTNIWQSQGIAPLLELHEEVAADEMRAVVSKTC